MRSAPRVLAAALLVAATLAQEPTDGPDPQLGEAAADPARALAALAAEPDSTRVADALIALATRYPDWARALPYGTSRGGRPLLALELRGPGAADQPGLAVVHDLVAGPRPQELLELAAARLARWEAAEDALEDPLAQARLLLVPLPDPDRFDGEAAPGRACLGLDFPVGWEPRAGAGGSGPWPLGEPETHGLATLLGGRAELSGVALFCAEPGVERLPGGLARHAAELLGLGVERLPSGAGLVQRLEALTLELPRLELTLLDVQPAGADELLVELAVVVRGRLPVGTARLRLSGAEARAFAQAPAGAQSFRPAPVGPHLTLAPGPGRALRVRALLTPASEGRVVVELASARAAPVRLVLEPAALGLPR